MDALFSPVVVGGVEIPNRFVMPPMTTRLADPEGHVTAALVAYYSARARGGVGLITVEMGSPEKVGRHRFRELGDYDDRFLAGLERLVGALHDAGARVSVQLGHGGSRARKAVSGETPIAPSPVPTPVYEVEPETVIPLGMTKARIEQTTRAFVEAARRMQRAGFDFVELHGAHGYLISQFLSPSENLRTDEYGGSLENRARFGLDVLRRIKSEVPGLPVIFRLGVEDFFPGGFVFEEGLRVAQWAAQAGADALSITAGHYRSLPSAERMIPPMAYPEGTFLDFAAQIKERVEIPVIGVGRLGNPTIAMAAVEDGKADMVTLGRALIADPGWVNKVRSGAATRRCLSCNHCVNSMRSGAHISCVVNPITGFELDFADSRPPEGEKICVVGAGPAGLSYASLVADRNDGLLFDAEEMTLAEYFRRWLKGPAKRNVRPSTYARYEQLSRNHLVPALGSLRLKKLTALHLENLYEDKLDEGLSARTVNYIHTTASKALGHAVAKDLLRRNVASFAEAPQPKGPEMLTLNREEVRIFLGAAKGDRLEALYVLALATGMRRSELLGLKWGDLDLEEGILLVRRGLTISPDGGVEINDPKRFSSKRRLEISTKVVAILKEHRRRQAEERLSAGPGRWRDEGFVFTSRSGGFVHPNTLYTAYFKKLRDRAGVPPIHFHDLRHTYATQALLLPNAKVKVVSETLGHKDVATTLRIYAHVLPGMQREAAEAMDSVLF